MLPFDFYDYTLSCLFCLIYLNTGEDVITLEVPKNQNTENPIIYHTVKFQKVIH